MENTKEAVRKLLKETFSHGLTMEDIIELFNDNKHEIDFSASSTKVFMINKKTSMTSGVYMVFYTDSAAILFGCTVGVYDVYPIYNTAFGKNIHIGEYYNIIGTLNDNNKLHIVNNIRMPENYGNTFTYELKDQPYRFDRFIKDNEDDIELFTHKLRLMLKDTLITKDDISEEEIPNNILKGCGDFI